MTRRLLIFLLFASSTLLWAQGEKGSIQGIVKDQQGAIISQATVLLVDLTTLQCQRSRSDNDGRYRFAELKPGKYQILIGSAAFATAARVLKVKPRKTAEFSPELKIAEGVKLITALEFSWHSLRA